MCLLVVWSTLEGGEDDLAPMKIDIASKQPDPEEQESEKAATRSEVPNEATTPPAQFEVHHTPKRQRTSRHDISRADLDSEDFTIDWKLDTLANFPPWTPQERASFDAQMMPPPRSAASAKPKRKRETKQSAYYEAWNPPSPSSFLGIAHTKSVLRKYNDEKAPWVVVPKAVKKRQI